ncbi:MAG: 7-cyano-7-deazaguanine synthase [Ktedonobacteraceae bacterium]|nr:7-cyano-7-deazaguanine synthase [Ktedonobacteraceae bacterium]
MLSVAYGVAVAERAEVVAIGVHAGDHFIYPDCRPAFIEAFQAMQKVAVDGSGEPTLRLDAPFLHLSKQQIVKLGTALDVPFVDTWSCYKGGERHCGTCGTCYERKEAFELAGEPDPTDYEG